MSPENTQLSRFLEDLRRFVRNEHQAQRQALARVWAMPIEQRIEEGHCVAGGSFHSFKPPSGVLISFPSNDSYFREGDLVRVSRGTPKCPLCEAVVVRAEDEFIEVEVWKKSPQGLGLESPKADLQLDESALDLERYYLEAIDELGKTEAGRERILPLLAGERKPVLDLPTFESEQDRAEQQGGFHDAQSTAVGSALATDLCWLIHGPPGTGKTRVLSWIVRGLVERGERVLVTGANHRTINNLLEAIARLAGDARGIWKITPFRDPSLALSQVGGFAEIPQAEKSGAFVIGAMPFAARTRRLSGVDFDTVIIDEASQVSPPLAAMAMLAGKRYILAGDHHQLPPVFQTRDAAPTGVADSIFEKLVGRGMDTMLTITHRLNEPLCEWPSTTFYLSRLEPSAASAGRRLTLATPSPEFSECLAPNPACIWLAVPHAGCRTSSTKEIGAIGRLLVALRDGGIRWEEVGVVVPFRRQARLLRKHLFQHLRQPLASFGLVADTVERMQGQEREVVIVSFVASDPVFVARVGSFLFRPQRLNVAVTRARTKVILVASPELVSQAKDLPEEISGHFLSLFEHACRVDY